MQKWKKKVHCLKQELAEVQAVRHAVEAAADGEAHEDDEDEDEDDDEDQDAKVTV